MGAIVVVLLILDMYVFKNCFHTIMTWLPLCLIVMCMLAVCYTAAGGPLCISIAVLKTALTYLVEIISTY